MAPVIFWAVTVFLFGITIGSFLTAVIYRLGRPHLRLSLLEPKRSMCPNCRHSLGVVDLIPLFSFLLSGQRCRYCKQPISWRYFGIELLTGLTFVTVYLKFPFGVPGVGPSSSNGFIGFNGADVATTVAMLAFAATLIPILFIDLESFMIPTSLNLVATLIPFVRDAWGILNHQAGFELLGGWMPRSLLGALIGTLIFGAVRVAGWLYKGVEAMGLGDVYLARGMGAMLLIVMPASLAYWPFPLWVILSCVSGILVFPLFVLLKKSGGASEKKSEKKLDRYGNPIVDVEIGAGENRKPVATDETPDTAVENKGGSTESDLTESSLTESSLTESGLTESASHDNLFRQLRDVGEVLIGYDAYWWLRYTLDRNYRASIQAEEDEEWARVASGEEEEWVPAATAIPFGPFLVVGFMLTIFFGENLIMAYLAYAHLLPASELPNR